LNAVEPFDTFVRARIGGAFFNAGPRTEDSYLNDVYAWIGVGRTVPTDDPPNTLHVYARVTHCTNASCGTTTPIGTEDPQDLGTVKLNKKVKLRITWDPGLDRFTFKVGSAAEFPIYYSGYGYSDTAPPGTENGGKKRIQIQNILPNCEDKPRLFGYIEASFDNIKVSY